MQRAMFLLVAQIRSLELPQRVLPFHRPSAEKYRDKIKNAAIQRHVQSMESAHETT